MAFQRASNRSAIMQLAARYGVLSILCCVLAQQAKAEPSVENILPPFAHTLFCIQYPTDCDQTPGRSLSNIPVVNRRHQLSVVQE